MKRIPRLSLRIVHRQAGIFELDAGSTVADIAIAIGRVMQEKKCVDRIVRRYRRGKDYVDLPPSIPE